MKCNFLKNSAYVTFKGQVLPCTMASQEGVFGKICNDSLEDVFLKRIKNDTMDNTFCKRCIQNEAYASVSYSRWNNSDDPFYFLDLRLDSMCNFRCVTCDKYTSYGFKKEDDTAKLYDISEVIFKNIEFIRKFKRIYLGGGEPFLERNTLKFLQNLNTEQEVLISSNISILNEDTIQELKRFKRVIFYPSIDGTGEIGAYIRFGFNEETFKTNFFRLKNDFECIPVVTVSALNIMHLDGILEFLKDITGEYNKVYLNILEYPDQMRINILPDFLRVKILQNLETLLLLSDASYIVDAPYNLYSGIELLQKKLVEPSISSFNHLRDALVQKDILRKNTYKILFKNLL